MNSDHQQNGYVAPYQNRERGTNYTSNVNYTSYAPQRLREGPRQSRYGGYMVPQQLNMAAVQMQMSMQMHPQQLNMTPQPMMFRSRSFSPPMISPTVQITSAPPSARSSPQSPGSPFSEHICVDCLHGLCDGNCGKRHPNNLIQTKAEMDKKKTTVLCFYYVHAKCSRTDCAFLHVDTHNALDDTSDPCTQDKSCGTNDNMDIDVDYIIRSIKALGMIGNTNAVMRIQKEAEDVWLAHVDSAIPDGIVE